jgi:glycosyltransferase involved in cell wall biosynthesis
LAYLQRQGFDVALATSPGWELDEVSAIEKIKVFSVPMCREVSPWKDMRALAKLLGVIQSYRPDIINASTPKAGFLGMLAAKAANVPVRIYTLRGLRLETTRGIKRQLLIATEKLAAACAQRVVCVSESLRHACIDLRLAPSEKICVLGSGSSNGVDLSRFPAAEVIEKARFQIRKDLDIPGRAPVVGFVGRFTRDKGIVELMEAFAQISEQFREVRLILLGDFEKGDGVPERWVRRIREDSRIVWPGFVQDTAPYYPAMDVFAFPSYREGFPNAPLEAGAAGIPVVGFKAVGTVDAVKHGLTGTLVPKGDTDALARAIRTYLADPELRRSHGAAGRERVEKFFRCETVWEAWVNEYQRLLAEKDINFTAETAGISKSTIKATRSLRSGRLIQRRLCGSHSHRGTEATESLNRKYE